MKKTVSIKKVMKNHKLLMNKLNLKDEIMIQNKSQYDVYLFEYETLYSRFENLTDKEMSRLKSLESDLIFWEQMELKKN